MPGRHGARTAGLVHTAVTPAPIATQALVRIAALYAIEADIRGLSADERRQARQRSTKPLLDDLRLWLEAIAGAIRYTLSRWDGLTRFLEDGRIEIDSNVVERAIRPIALGRKNRYLEHSAAEKNLGCLPAFTASHLSIF